MIKRFWTTRSCPVSVDEISRLRPPAAMVIRKGVHEWELDTRSGLASDDSQLDRHPLAESSLSKSRLVSSISRRVNSGPPYAEGSVQEALHNRREIWNKPPTSKKAYLAKPDVPPVLRVRYIPYPTGRPSATQSSVSPSASIVPRRKNRKRFEDNMQGDLKLPKNVFLNITYFNDGLGINLSGPKQRTWKCAVRSSKPFHKVFQSMQEILEKDGDYFEFFYSGISLDAEDTPQKVGMCIGETYDITCMNLVGVKILHPRRDPVYYYAYSITRISEIKALYITTLPPLWDASSFSLKLGNRLVPEQSVKSEETRRRRRESSSQGNWDDVRQR
ncbi:hypothetical protein C8R45DRAFT_350292 [Mycena sanguinolenta]|nr:hypothetical protein C8R45DRAFT_350292 [Mycena sanguinolenta]